MVEIVAPDPRFASLLLHERLTDTVIGAIAAVIGLVAFNLLQRSITRVALGARGDRPADE